MSLFDKILKRKDPFADLGKNDSFDSTKSDPFATPDPLAQNSLSNDPLTSNSPFPKLDEADPSEMSMQSPHPNNVPQNLPGQHAGQSGPQPNLTNSHQMELILSKLDTIKLNIENINLRMSKIENELQKKDKKIW